MKVSNPLTIIAIFSGLAEALATVSLLNLPAELQEVFLYFVMAFPCLIVVIFFLILNFNNNVLYAPSDFSNPEDYLKANGFRIKQVLRSETEAIESKLNERSGEIINPVDTANKGVEVAYQAVNIAKEVIEELFEPSLELLVFQILEKPVAQRMKIIESIESKRLREMLLSIHEKVLKAESK